LGAFVGAWVQFLAVIVAVVAGIAATIQNYRIRSGGSKRWRLLRDVSKDPAHVREQGEA